MGMGFKSQVAKGFELNDSIAKKLDLEEEYARFKKGDNHSYAVSSIAAKLEETLNIPDDVEPEIYTFIYERGPGAEIQNLEGGFEWGKTYLFFRHDSLKSRKLTPFLKRVQKAAPEAAPLSAEWTELV